jgi:hypothetical protein
MMMIIGHECIWGTVYRRLVGLGRRNGKDTERHAAYIHLKMA